MRRLCLSVALASCFVLGISRLALAAPITYAEWFAASGSGGIGDAVTVNGATTRDFTFVDILADFGVNRVSVTSKESSATSAWLDEWTITGGTGTGVLLVDWTLDGTLTVTDTLACPGCDSSAITYTSLFAAANVFGGTELYSAAQVGTGTTEVQQSGTVAFTFTYDTPFHAGFKLSGGVGDDVASGSVNFFNSALLTAVILPAGATLTNHQYARDLSRRDDCRAGTIHTAVVRGWTCSGGPSTQVVSLTSRDASGLISAAN
jgi:hypothetical protein